MRSTSAQVLPILHEESGQREDINNYIRSFVDADRAMRRWRKEDRELVITTLSERADGMFRRVFCQLDAHTSMYALEHSQGFWTNYRLPLDDTLRTSV